MAEEKKTIPTQNEIDEPSVIGEGLNFAVRESFDEPLMEKVEKKKPEAAPEVQEEPIEEAFVEAIKEDDTPLPQKDEATESDGYMNVEHFSDFYTKKEEEEELILFEEEDGDSEESLDTDGEFVEEQEYENLTIFDEEKEDLPKVKKEREESPDNKPYTPEKPRGVDARFDLIELFVFTLVAIMLITTFFFKHSVVDGSSMESTLHGGDHLIISDFLYEPKQYDIVVVDDRDAHEAPMVKRVIATEGQTVRLEQVLVPTLSTEDRPYYTLYVFVDGEKVRDDFVHYTGSDNIMIDYQFEDHKVVSVGDEGEYFIFEYTVPENEIYVLGDHRDQSKDSRMFGSVSVDTVLGKVLLRIYPFESFGTVK